MGLEFGVLGKAIKQARLEQHFSQEELAEKLGISPTHMKHIESEHRKPSVEVLFDLIKILNLSLDSLFSPKKSDAYEQRHRAERLLNECNEKQLKIIIATLEAMLD